MNRRKNFVWNLLGSGMYSANSFLLLMAVSKTFGVELAGDFGVAHATAQIMYTIGLFGVNTFQITDYRKEFAFADYHRLRLLTCSLMLSIAVLFSLLYWGTPKSSIIVLLSCYTCIYAYSNLYQSYFFNENRLDISGKGLFIQSLASYIVFVAACMRGSSIYVCVAAMLIANMLFAYWFSIRPLRKQGIIFLKRGHSQIRSIVKNVWPIFLSVFVLNLITNLTKYFTDYYLGSEQSGIYNILFILFAVVNLMSGFVFNPLLNDYHKLIVSRDYAAYKRKIQQHIILVMGVTVLLGAFCYLYGTQILSVLYSVDLSAYKLELAIVCFGGGMLALTSLLFYQLILFRKQSFVLTGYVCGLAAEFAISLCLIPKLGVCGAALSVSIGYAVVFLIFYVKIFFITNTDEFYR